jgi:hypothetical protein
VWYGRRPRQVRDMLRWATRLQIAVLIRKSNHGIQIADIDPLWIGTQWIERNAEWSLQSTGEKRHLFGLAVAGHPTKDSDVAGFGFSYE